MTQLAFRFGKTVTEKMNAIFQELSNNIVGYPKSRSKTGIKHKNFS